MVELALPCSEASRRHKLWPEPGTPNALAVLAVFCIPFVDLLTVYVYHRDHLPLGTLSGSVRCPIHGPSKVL
jgi:hypothetical protein